MPIDDADSEDNPLFEVPWDEFLEHDALLASENPSISPEGNETACDSVEAIGTPAESEDSHHTLVLTITFDKALKYIMFIKKLCVGDTNINEHLLAIENKINSKKSEHRDQKKISAVQHQTIFHCKAFLTICVKKMTKMYTIYYQS